MVDDSLTIAARFSAGAPETNSLAVTILGVAGSPEDGGPHVAM